MKFLDGVKLGAALYVGWSVMEAIDEALMKTKLGDKLLDIHHNLAKQKSENMKEPEEKIIKGFCQN